MKTTERVSVALVQAWASATLAEWMTGYTDFREDWGGQYHIRLLGGCGPVEDPTGVLVEITTFEGDDPRRYQVLVTATEVRE